MTNFWFNIKEYLTEQYFHLLVGYVITAGLVSFAVIYRMGPPSDQRTLNLISWSMQLVSLVMIFTSSYYHHASLALIIVVVSWAAIPAWLKSGVNTQIRKRFFKPKVRPGQMELRVHCQCSDQTADRGGVQHTGSQRDQAGSAGTQVILQESGEQAMADSVQTQQSQEVNYVPFSIVLTRSGSHTYHNPPTQGQIHLNP